VENNVVDIHLRAIFFEEMFLLSRYFGIVEGSDFQFSADKFFDYLFFMRGPAKASVILYFTRMNFYCIRPTLSSLDIEISSSLIKNGYFAQYVQVGKFSESDILSIFEFYKRLSINIHFMTSGMLYALSSIAPLGGAVSDFKYFHIGGSASITLWQTLNRAFREQLMPSHEYMRFENNLRKEIEEYRNRRLVLNQAIAKEAGIETVERIHSSVPTEYSLRFQFPDSCGHSINIDFMADDCAPLVFSISKQEFMTILRLNLPSLGSIWVQSTQRGFYGV
jgi:hypothetical protein